MAPEPRAALQALLQDATVDDHEAILRAANAAIKASKGDLAAQHARVVALLKLDRFHDALRALSDGGAQLEADCLLEKAYALYKADKLEQAAATVKAFGSDSRKLRHVAAQIAYREERFDEAEALYKRLLSDEGATEEHDLRINLAATLAQQAWHQGPPSIEPPDRSPPTPSNSFEVCFNDACALIARESFDQAAGLLQRAMRLCDASDDLTDEEKKTELAPILAQRAFAFSKLGDTDKALELYQSLDADNISEADFALLVEINKRALQPPPDNPFFMRRSIDARSTAAAKAKLFTCQSTVLARNLSALDLATFKWDGLRRRSCRQMAQVRGPTVRLDVNQASVMNAAAATCGKPERQQARKLTSMCKQRPENVGLLLTMVQLRIRDGKPGAALSLLQAFLGRIDRAADTEASDVRHSPGLVSLAVALMQAQSMHASAKAELIKAIKYWLERPGSARAAASLMKEAGVALARSSSAEELSLAASALQSLAPAHRSNPVVSAGLVAALAATGALSQLSDDVARLPAVDNLTRGVDVAALASAGVVRPPSKSGLASSSSAKKRAAAEEEEEAAALSGDMPTKKRKRRRLPKNYDPKAAPDPERWLPLRDRSSYRRKAKKGGKKKAFELTQGGLVKEEEEGLGGLVGGGAVRVEKDAGSSSGAQAKRKPKKKGKGKR